jgi:chromosomal replication initiation ATPase DnaA
MEANNSPVRLKQDAVLIDSIIKDAQTAICEQTGLNVILVAHFPDKLSTEDVEQLFKDMCNCWGVDLDWIREKGRDKDRPLKRKILWVAAKNKYPTIPLAYLAQLTGVTDHSTVVKGIRNIRKWLEVQDYKTLKHYRPVQHFFAPKN